MADTEYLISKLRGTVWRASATCSFVVGLVVLLLSEARITQLRSELIMSGLIINQQVSVEQSEGVFEKQLQQVRAVKGVQ
jgi:hypothetical protein